MPAKSIIELEELQLHFHRPMAEVAKHFGVCTTFFKKVCRVHGIKRWPYRKLKSLQKKISHLQSSHHTNDMFSDQKMSGLQQRLDELRKIQPWSEATSQSPESKSDMEEDTTDDTQCSEQASSLNQPAAAPMDLLPARGSLIVDPEAEELACRILTSWRRGESVATIRAIPQPVAPVSLPALDKLHFAVGVKRQERPDRSRSPSSENSVSSGGTMPGGSPMSMGRERRMSVMSLDSMVLAH